MTELVNNSFEKEISREIFENVLYRLIEKQYVKCTWKKNLFVTAKNKSHLNKESKLIIGTACKEDKEYHLDNINENEVSNRVNGIDNDSDKSEESLLEDFGTFKNSFLAEVNVFKKQLQTS